VADDDRAHWNRRYRADAYDFTPPEWLVRLAPRIKPDRASQTDQKSRALDLACGGGRNALFLAELGYEVDAWDISDVAIAILEKALGEQQNARLRVRPRIVDLETVELPENTYDLILDSHYLDRNLFRPLQRALRPGGLLVLRTFLQPSDGKYNPAHALEPGELRRAFAALIELDCTEDPDHGLAFLLAKKRAQANAGETSSVSRT
jgi:SAM-dependent methyltransferase